MRRTRRSLLAVLVLAALASSPESGVHADVKLASTSPLAAAPGATIDLHCEGSELGDATFLWTSFASDAHVLPRGSGDGSQPSRTGATFRVTIPSGVPPHIGGLRVATGRGVSNLRLFMIDDLSTVLESGGNRTRGAAQSLAIPTAVEGTVDAQHSDFYQFTASKGQRFTAEVVARRLGSRLDPLLRLLDGEGNELSSSDDAPGLGGDSQIAHTFSEGGKYVLEVRDARYRGGGGYTYRLRAGSFPLIRAPFPAVVERGTRTQVALYDRGTGQVIRRELHIRADFPHERYWFAVESSAASGTAFTGVAVSSVSETLEAEPNDTRKSGTRVTLPGAANGRFETEGDRDWYVLEVKKGERWRFVGRTWSLGSPATLFLRLHDASGVRLAEAHPAGTDEVVIERTFKSDGPCWLLAEDLVGDGGPDRVYRIEGRKIEPGFSLAVETDTFNAPKTGVFVGKVTCSRRDYDGPITLSLASTSVGEDLAGWVVKNNVIADGKSETTIEVTLPPHLSPGRAIEFGIVGTAEVTESTVVKTIEAERFARGNLKEIDGYISDDGKDQVYFAEYDLDLPADEYTVSLRYAAAAVRASTLLINGKIVKKDALGHVTGGWTRDFQRWHVEGKFLFREDKNVLRLERRGVFSHLDQIRISREDRSSRKKKHSVRARARTLDALSKSLGLRFPPADLDGSLMLGVGFPRREF